MLNFKDLSKEDKLIKVCESVFNNEPKLLESLAKGNTNEQFYAKGKWYDHERFALKSFFIDKDIEQAKRHYYTCGRLDEFVINKYDAKILDYGLNHLSYALLSDNEALIKRYSELSHSSYVKTIKSGSLCYAAQLFIRGNYSELTEYISILRKRSEREAAIKLDIAYFEVLVKSDQSKLEEILSEFVTPKIHKQRNKAHELINEFISHPAIGYAKLAWLKGIEVKINSPLVPHELLPITPNKEYQEAYTFLKESQKPL